MDYIRRKDALTDSMCVGISCQECPFLIHPVNGGCKIENYIKSIPAADVIGREDATKSMLKHCEDVLSGANVSYETADIYRTAYQHAIGDIKAFPAADVVEVIRCKECKHFNLNKWGKVNDVPLIVAHEICDFWGEGCKTDKDGYCLFAERRG